MSKWIDADAFLKEYCEPYPHIYKAMSRAMADAPSIDIEPKRGEWVNARDGVSDHVKCTNCFRTYYLGIVENYNFCPNCGARMKGADDDD